MAEGDSALKDEVVIDPTARITSIEMQMNDPALKDFNVRLALSRAIDREALVDVVYDGVNAPATYWVVKGLTGFQGNETFDSTSATTLPPRRRRSPMPATRTAAGFPELKITYRDYAGTPQRGRLPREGAGRTPWASPWCRSSSTARRARQRFNAETFQLFQGGWQLDYPDIENPLVGLFDTDGGNNHYNCSDPEVDAAFKAAASATSEAARIKAYQDVETRVVDDAVRRRARSTRTRMPFLVDSKIGGVVPNGTIDAGHAGQLLRGVLVREEGVSAQRAEGCEQCVGRQSAAPRTAPTMTGYALRRILWVIPVLWAVATITFFLMHAVPGGPFTEDKTRPPAVEAALERQYGLNDPLWKQYANYITDAARGDLGISFQGDRNVNELLRDGFFVTAQLGVLGIIFAVAVGMTLGTVSALNHNGPLDYLGVVFATVGASGAQLRDGRVPGDHLRRSVWAG